MSGNFLINEWTSCDGISVGLSPGGKALRGGTNFSGLNKVRCNIYSSHRLKLSLLKWQQHLESCAGGYNSKLVSEKHVEHSNVDVTFKFPAVCQTKLSYYSHLDNTYRNKKVFFFSLSLSGAWSSCGCSATVLLEREQITGNKGHIDESVQRGGERKIGRKGLGLWTTPKHNGYL